MLLSQEKKVLFVHIQKTGGSSVTDILKSCISDLNTYLGTHDHASRAKHTLGRNYDTYYKFAFVRNPWDRLVSWYTMIREKGEEIPSDEQYRLWRYVLENSSNFEEFVLNCTDIIDDVDGRKSFLYNQYDYISDENGKLIVDFVGKYENFESDLRTVLKRMGVSNAEIPHANKSEHLHYGTYYTPRTRDIIARRYEKDIQQFDYSFQA